MTRINKYLAERGVASRRASDDMVAQGRVKVNGEMAQPGAQVEDGDVVEVDGSPIDKQPERKVYYKFNKPVGILSSMDAGGQDTIGTVLAHQGEMNERLFYIGRLDVASSGLVILTNDGALAQAMSHPKFDHEKEYVVQVDRDIEEGQLNPMRRGMMILGSMTKPAGVRQLDQRKFVMTLTEGRNKQIRRMCEEVGLGVTALKRVRMGAIELGDLPTGRIEKLKAIKL